MNFTKYSEIPSTCIYKYTIDSKYLFDGVDV